MVLLTLLTDLYGGQRYPFFDWNNHAQVKYDKRDLRPNAKRKIQAITWKGIVAIWSLYNHGLEFTKLYVGPYDENCLVFTNILSSIILA